MFIQCHTGEFLKQSSRLILLDKQTLNLGGTPPPQIGVDVDWGRLFTAGWLSDSIARICLAFFVTQTLEAVCSRWLPRRGPWLLVVYWAAFAQRCQTDWRSTQEEQMTDDCQTCSHQPAAFQHDKLLISGRGIWCVGDMVKNSTYRQNKTPNIWI